MKKLFLTPILVIALISEPLAPALAHNCSDHHHDGYHSDCRDTDDQKISGEAWIIAGAIAGVAGLVALLSSHDPEPIPTPPSPPPPQPRQQLQPVYVVPYAVPAQQRGTVDYSYPSAATHNAPNQ